MKNEQKKLNNKGFSLVELIVVIAIMAILVGVLAPSVMGQIEKSRLAKDTQSVDVVRTAVMAAVADPNEYDTFSYTLGTAFQLSNVRANASVNKFDEAVIAVVGNTALTFSSADYKTCTEADVTITVNSDLTVSVTLSNGTDSITLP